MKYLVLSLLACSCIAAQAEDTSATASDEPKLGWSTTAELGAITTSGNTKGTSVTGKIDSSHEMEHWSNEYSLSAFYKRDETTTDDGNTLIQTSAERYAASAKGGYRLDSDSARLFIYGSHIDDRFGAYTEYSTVAIGYGDQIFKTKDMSLDGEIGPGYARGKTDAGEQENGLLVRSAATFRWQLSDNARFKQTVALEYGEDNKRTVAESSLTSKLNGRLQMKAAFSVQNDSKVPVGKQKTDTQTSLTLVYSF
ncbi:DUF481 domain-containing protein [Rheinheimera sp.]|uniref:DUF481 domain-containing protein n=1 Tax=Rheinheimera sp. TaxID=1869214 RepID=UPI00307FC4CD